jgi:hypothetical protein
MLTATCGVGAEVGGVARTGWNVQARGLRWVAFFLRLVIFRVVAGSGSVN